jgi:hypothetical protein
MRSSISPRLVRRCRTRRKSRAGGGRPRVFTDAAIQTALTLKVLYQLPLRAAQGMVGSLIRMAGLDWRVPTTALSRGVRGIW